MIEETRSVLGDLIAFPTVSCDSNLQLIAYAAERLTHCGARVTILRDEGGHKANLFATLGPEEDGGIILSGHSDVVPVEGQDWTSDPFAMRQDDGRLYGRGACDMKGFIAAALVMAPRYAELDLRRPVHFSVTYDEEVGCLGARQLVDDLKRLDIRPSVVIVGEPTELRVIEGHKGCYEYTTSFTGTQGHGSAPDLGVNAVEYAVRYVTRLLELREELKPRAPADSRFDPPWTTLQVGRIAGGIAHNVIAGHCSVDWEMRPIQRADADFVKSGIADYCEAVLLPAMRAVAPEAAIETQIIGEVQGLVPMTENQARDLVAELTGANGSDVVAFGTEAGLFQELGMSVVVCGPGSIEQAHKADEYIDIDQLRACLDMLSGLTGKLR